jgi:beta-ribofuranosylaminobenzene 5'-phosphate synthase
MRRNSFADDIEMTREVGIFVMIQIQAYSRLHFGFLNPNGAATPAFRCFGGVGLMITQPNLSLRIEPAAAWSAEGPEAERALAFARRFAAASCEDEHLTDLPPQRLGIERLMPAHAGLGSGSQLGLSVARALAASWDLSCDVATLARRVGRGLRSALGTHGFEQGGFLVESGKISGDKLAPLVARQPFPETWRLVMVLPPHHSAGLHGGGEREAFARLSAGGTGVSPVGKTETLCRLVLLGLLPALVERDVEAFGEALYEFNARVGEAFAPVQGGVYASPHIAELIEFVRAQNIRGVGQSSWGPAVFAVAADADRGEHLAGQLRRRFSLPPSAVWTTPACNHGATLKKEN